MEFKTSSARSHWSPASRLTHTRNLILDTKNDGLWKGVSQASNFECVFLGCIYVEFQGCLAGALTLGAPNGAGYHWSPTGLLHML